MEVTDEMRNLVDEKLGYIDNGWSKWGEYRDETIRRIIELHEQSKWISVNDKLPENGKYVLWRSVSVDMYERKEHFRIDVCFNNRPPKIDYIAFTHWQYLPEFKE